MAIKTSCPHCEQPLSAVDEDVGKERICPVCENEWVVPSKKIEPYAVFGDYSTTRPLGVGGNCEVHLALHKGTGQQVALKIFFVDDVDQKDCMRFEKEIRHITTIEHPGIIRAFDGGFEKRLVIERDGREREEAYYFLAMEYVQGETLDDILDSNGPMDEYEAVRIATRLAVVMEFLWENYQIMHRDLKPGNVMHSYSGEVKLMDFGIAKSAYDAQLTGARTIVGTPYYMSPEQCTPSRTIDLRSDIYGLGAPLPHGYGRVSF